MGESYGFFMVFILACIRKTNGATVGIYRDAQINDRDQGYNYHHYHHHSDSFGPQNFPEHRRRFADYNPQIEEIASSPDSGSFGNSAEQEHRDPNYPYDEIRNYLKHNPLLGDYFVGLPTIPQIGNRDGLLGSEDEGKSMCKVKERRLFYPQKLKNINNVWKTVVNIKDEYEQGVETRTCVSKGKCTELESLPFGQTSYCYQEFLTKELMVYNSTTNFDLFRFPSCCVCKIKRIED